MKSVFNKFVLIMMAVIAMAAQAKASLPSALSQIMAVPEDEIYGPGISLNIDEVVELINSPNSSCRATRSGENIFFSTPQGKLQISTEAFSVSLGLESRHKFYLSGYDMYSDGIGIEASVIVSDDEESYSIEGLTISGFYPWEGFFNSNNGREFTVHCR